MTIRQYLVLMSIATAICWGIWAFIIFTLDPNSAGISVFLFFYLALFLSLIGTFSVLLFIIRKLLIKNDEVIFRHVKKTFRQSVTVSALLIFALILLQKQLLTWWNAIILIILFVVFEATIFSNRHYKNKNYVGQFGE